MSYWLYATQGARNGHGAEVENGRLNSTGYRLVQAARATIVSFAFALAHARGVNCLISVIFAKGRRVNESLR
jgi:Na+(H+)/acetate symporter ActP